MHSIGPDRLARGHVGPRCAPRPVRGAAARGARVLARASERARASGRSRSTPTSRRSARTSATFSTEVGSAFILDQDPMALEFHRMTLLQMDPPKHNRYRRLVSAGFTPRMITMLADSIATRARAHRRVDRRSRRDRVHAGHRGRAADAGHLRDDRHPRGRPAPRHRARQPAGRARRIPTSSRPRRTRSSHRPSSTRCATSSPPIAGQNPRDDIMSILVHAEVDGDRLTDTELNLFFVLLVVAGNETTRNLIAHAMLALIERPDARAELVAGIDDDALWADRGRGDAPLGRVDPQLPPHGHARHRDPRRPDQGRRQGGDVLRVRQPRRRGVRGPDDVRHPPHARTTT